MPSRVLVVAAVLVGAGPAFADVAWPAAIIERPYALPGDTLSLYGDFDVVHFSVGSGANMIAGTGEALHLGGAYGITTKITTGLDYAFPFAGDSVGKQGRGPLVGFGEYDVFHDAALSVTASADFTADFSATDAMANPTVATTLHAGAAVRYRLSPTLCVFTGAPSGPGLVGQQLSVRLESNGPITFTLPVGAGMQVTPRAFAFASTTLAAIAIAHSPFADSSNPNTTKRAVFVGGDNLGIPLTLGGWFALATADVGVMIADDLRHPGDLYTVALGLRWYR